MGSFEPAEELEFMIIANRNLLQRNRKLSKRNHRMEIIVRRLAYIFDQSQPIKETDDTLELGIETFREAKKLCNFYRIRPQPGK